MKTYRCISCRKCLIAVQTMEGTRCPWCETGRLSRVKDKLSVKQLRDHERARGSAA